MKFAYMFGLGLQVPLSSSQFYHDDGVVKDIHGHLEMLQAMYKSNEKIKENPRRFGLCYQHVYNGCRAVHVFQKDHKQREANIVTKIHEEIHALQILGKTDFINKKFQKEGLAVDITLFDREIAAQLGGIHTLVQKDMDPRKIKEVFSPRNYDRALQIYESCYFPK